MVGLATAARLGVRPLLDSLASRDRFAAGWTTTLLDVVVIIAWFALMARWSALAGWTQAHVLAAAGGQLVAIGVVAFTVQPLGHPDAVAKYASNLALLALVLAVLAVAAARLRRFERLPEGFDPSPV
jgi:hypothetical protein